MTDDAPRGGGSATVTRLQGQSHTNDSPPNRCRPPADVAHQQAADDRADRGAHEVAKSHQAVGRADSGRLNCDGNELRTAREPATLANAAHQPQQQQRDKTASEPSQERCDGPNSSSGSED